MRSTPEALIAGAARGPRPPLALWCRGLVRRGPGGAILAGVDLDVPIGARLLMADATGRAGTALLRIAAGLLRPHAGRIGVAGSHGWNSLAARRRTGYVPAEPAFYGWLTVAETLALASRLRELDRRAERSEIGRVATELGLGDLLGLRVSRAMRSQRERLALAVALIGDPELLLLDDALRSVEEDERARLLRVLDSTRTLIMASREPAAQAVLCSRVALLQGGRLAVEIELADLERRGLPLSLAGLEALRAAFAGDAA